MVRWQAVRYLLALLALPMVGCTTIVDTDAGGTDAGGDVSSACVGDFQPCNLYSPPCCNLTYVCNGSTGICQAACESVNAVCSDNAQCCSGICNGTCQ